MECHRNRVTSRAQRDVGRAAGERTELAFGRARSLQKHDQRPATQQTVDTFVDDAGTVAVGNEARAPRRSTEEEVFVVALLGEMAFFTNPTTSLASGTQLVSLPP